LDCVEVSHIALYVIGVTLGPYLMHVLTILGLWQLWHIHRLWFIHAGLWLKSWSNTNASRG